MFWKPVYAIEIHRNRQLLEISSVFVIILLVLSRRGLQGKPGSVVLKKDKQNLIGISIGGGAPLCPCLYVVQVFDNTPASREGVLQAGDEIVGVNGKSLRGKTKVDVARAIQAVKVSYIRELYLARKG